MNLPQAFIFIGRSGSGKGTQVSLLKKYLEQTTPITSILEIETGKMFRQFIDGSSYSSRLAKEDNLAGKRGPSFILVWLWTQFLVEKLNGDEHLIFDGACRSLIEAEALDTALTFYKKQKPIIIYLDISNKTAITRLTNRGRYDDIIPEVINKRLDWFETDVMPVINYYRSDPLYNFIDINGDQETEKVHQDIVSRL